MSLVEQRNVRAHLLDIGENVDVRQRHALGLALGARGEQDHAPALAVRHARGQARARTGRWRRRPCRTARACRARLPDRRSRPRRAARSMSDSSLPSSMNLCAVTMRLTLAALQRRQHVRHAGGEIQHGRHAAVRRDGEERDHRTDAGGQHHADGFARRRAPLQRMTQRERAAHDVVIGELAFVAVDHDGALAAVTRARGDKRAEQGLPRTAEIEGGVGNRVASVRARRRLKHGRASASHAEPAVSS